MRRCGRSGRHAFAAAVGLDRSGSQFTALLCAIGAIGGKPGVAYLRSILTSNPKVVMKALVEGIVIIEAVIDARGRVSETRILRSVPILDEAALEAVRQWEYTPTLLDGVPTAVVMTITVTLRKPAGEGVLVAQGGSSQGYSLCVQKGKLQFAMRRDGELAEVMESGLDSWLASVERRLIVAALKETGGVQVQAARLLGISERSLWHRVKKLEIRVDRAVRD